MTRTFLEKLINFGLYFLLLTPLFFVQSTINPLVTVKTVVFQIVVEALLALYIFLAIFYKEFRPRLTAINLTLGGLLIILFITSVFGASLHWSLWSLPARMTGLVLWLHLAAFFLILSQVRINWVRFFSFSVVVSFLTALFPFVHLVFPDIFFDKGWARFSGTVGNPIFLASYLTLHVFLAFYLAHHFYKKGRQFWVIIFGLIAFFDLLAIILTQTRGALVGLLLAVLVLGYRVYRSQRSYRPYLIGLLIAAVLFGGFFWLTRDQLPIWQSIPGLIRFTGPNLGIGPRLIAWQTALRAWQERPLLGWGWENFYAALNQHYDPRMLSYGISETVFDRPHNVFLEFLVGGGLAGLFLYLLLLFFLFRATTKLVNGFWWQALLVAYLGQNFFAFDTINSYLIFFALMAFLDKADVNAPDYHPNTANVALPALAPLLAVLLLAVAGLGIYFINYRVGLASYYQYWGLNYLVNQLPEEGLIYLRRAEAVPNVYRDFILRDGAINLVNFWKQGIITEEKEIHRAVTNLQTAISHQPHHYYFRLGLADMIIPIYQLNPERYLKLAEQELLAAQALSPKRQATYFIRAKIRRLQDDRQGALAALEEAIRLDPEVAEPHFYYSIMLFDSGRVEEGLKEFQLATLLGRRPEKPGEARTIAGYLADAGDYRQAVIYFRMAIDQDPKDKEAKIKLGLTYYFAGQKELAKKYIAEVMRSEDLSKSPQYQDLKPIFQELGLE